MIEQRWSGMTIQEIADSHGETPSEVWKVVKAIPKPKAIARAKVLALVASGLSQREIAEKTFVSQTSVQRWVAVAKTYSGGRRGASTV